MPNVGSASDLTCEDAFLPFSPRFSNPATKSRLERHQRELALRTLETADWDLPFKTDFALQIDAFADKSWSHALQLRKLTLELVRQRIKRFNERVQDAVGLATVLPDELKEVDRSQKSAETLRQEAEFEHLWIETESHLDGQINRLPDELVFSEQHRKRFLRLLRLARRPWLGGDLSASEDSMSCPSYHIIANHLEFKTEAAYAREWNLAESFAYIHEVEHVVQTHKAVWNSRFIPDFAKTLQHQLLVYSAQLARDLADHWRGSNIGTLRQIAATLISKQEIPAIGAQFELATRIPTEIRSEMIASLNQELAQLRAGTSSYAREKPSTEKLRLIRVAIDMRVIALESLLRADLDKHEFIIQMLPYHGYDAQSLSQKRIPQRQTGL